MTIDEIIAATPDMINGEVAVANALTPAVVQEIMTRSAAGEGVMRILLSMKINPYDGTDWLKANKSAEVRLAKREQIRRKFEQIRDRDR